MSKIHYLLIFLIITTLGVSIWLLSDKENPVGEVIKKPKALNISKGEKQKNGYIQGFVEVPDLTEGFKRCLNRGYNDLQKEVLAEAEAYFSNRQFESGKFSWNKVSATNDFGEGTIFYLESTDSGIELSSFDMENGKKGALKEKRASSLEELKELLLDMNVVSNEYAQSFKDKDIQMTLILSNGLMKSLKIISPKKSVTCKP